MDYYLGLHTRIKKENSELEHSGSDLPNASEQVNKRLVWDAYECSSKEARVVQLANEMLRLESVNKLEQQLSLEIKYFQIELRESLIYYEIQRAFSNNYYLSGHNYFYPYDNFYPNKNNYYLNPNNYYFANDGFGYTENNYYSNDHYAYSQKNSRPRSREYKALHSNSVSSLSNRIISIARHNLGYPVWAVTKFASVCERGYLGCAATVSELLQESGLKINGSASVSNLVHELKNSGWHKIKIDNKNQFLAGDVVYGLRGNHAHIGIITAVDKGKVLVCDNSSASGTLKERTIESGGSFTPTGRFAGYLYVLRSDKA